MIVSQIFLMVCAVLFDGTPSNPRWAVFVVGGAGSCAAAVMRGLDVKHHPGHGRPPPGYTCAALFLLPGLLSCSPLVRQA